MKIYDTIRCHDKADVRKTLRSLSIAGFHAVVGGDGLTITITEAPGSSYLVQAADQNGRQQKAYCDTYEEAMEIAAEYGNQYEYVEVLNGYPGEWKEVSET